MNQIALIVQALILVITMACASVYDIKARLVDDRACWIIFAAGLITVSPASFLGGLLAGIPFYLGAGFGKNGAGDIWIAAAVGFVLGPSRTIAGLTLFLAAYGAYIFYAAIKALIRKTPMVKSCPLVPFITAGFLPAYFWA